MQGYSVADMKGFVSSLREARFDVSMCTHGSIRPREMPREYPRYADGVPYTAGFLHLDGRLVLTHGDDPVVAGYHSKITEAIPKTEPLEQSDLEALRHRNKPQL